MKVVALAAAMVASSGIASAGYVGLGIGTAPAVSADGVSNDLGEDGRSGRLIVGHRFGRFAIEGALGRFSTILEDNGGGGPAYDVYQGQVAAKYGLPLGDGFEVYGRLGLHKMWWGNEDERFDVEGSGLLVGAGFEYRFKASLAGGFSVFVDYQYSRADLEGDTFVLGDTSARMWTLGATIGF